MVDSNLEQREKILLSEKAWAYQVKLEALNHQGIKSANPGELSVAILSEQTGESKNQIFRLVRLTKLIVALLDKADAKQLAFNPAAELSYLSVTEQAAVASAMESYNVKPSLSQAKRLKELSKAGDLILLYQLLHRSYKKHPDNKDFWIIDEPAAVVVRRIFRLTLEGKGLYQIACILTDEKVLVPSHYLKMTGNSKWQKNVAYDPYTWGIHAIERIVQKQEYCGDVVNFKTSKHVKDKRSTFQDESEWVIFENVGTATATKAARYGTIKTHQQGSKQSCSPFSTAPLYGKIGYTIVVAGYSLCGGSAPTPPTSPKEQKFCVDFWRGVWYDYP